MLQYSLQISSKSEMVMREPFSESGDLTRNDPYKNMGKLLNLKSYANKHLICIRNIADHTAANWRVKKLNLNTIFVF